MEFKNPLASIRWKKIVGWSLFVLLLGLSGYSYFSYGLTISDGYRDGTLIKFSHKGYLFKTYEGELNQGGIANPNNGAMLANQIWHFSVKDQATAEKLNLLGGKVVRLHYRQYRNNFFWEGETPYLVDAAEEVK